MECQQFTLLKLTILSTNEEKETMQFSNLLNCCLPEYPSFAVFIEDFFQTFCSMSSMQGCN